MTGAAVRGPGTRCSSSCRILPPALSVPGR